MAKKVKDAAVPVTKTAKVLPLHKRIATGKTKTATKK